MDTNSAGKGAEIGGIERASAAQSAIVALAVSIALVMVTQSGPMMRPMLDVEPIRSIPYARAALATLADIIVMVLLLRMSGLSGATMARLSGVFTPIARPFVFGVVCLAPAVAVCLALVPPAQQVTLADVAWKVLAGPFFEELIYRGWAVGVLMRVCGWPLLAACLWPAAFFGAAHAWQGGDWQEIAGIVAVTSAGGLLFGWLYARWNFSLWPPVFLHAGLNSLWLTFGLGENAIGGWLGNGLRLGVVALAVALTVALMPRRGQANDRRVWVWLGRAATAVLVIVVAIPLWIMASAAIAGRADKIEVEYLRRNAVALDLREADARLRLNASDYEKRLFLLGEAHGVAVGQTLDLALLRHLNATAGVRFYVAEIDPAQAEWFNRYLDSGDTAFLDRVFSFWARERYQWGNRDFFDKIVAIRALNRTLAPERRIRFAGMDRLQDAALMQQHLSELLERVPAASWRDADRMRAVLRNPQSAADATRDGPLALAGAQFGGTLTEAAPAGVADGDWRKLRAAMSMLSDRRTMQWREEMITAAFERLLSDPHLRDEKFYGLWGMFHVVQAPVNDDHPFAFNLQRGAFANEIVSVGVFNLDSRMMLPAGSLPFLQADASGYATMTYSMDSALFSTLEGIESAKAAARGDATIFGLSAAGSPYLRSKRLARLHGVFGLLQPFEIETAKAPPSGAMNYVILVRGSAATKPL